MKTTRLAGSAFFLTGVAGIYAMLLLGLHRTLDIYGERFGCGCGRGQIPAVLLKMVAISDFLTYRWEFAYPLLVVALLLLWLWRRKRLAGLKPSLKEVEPRDGVWPPAPKV